MQPTNPKKCKPPLNIAMLSLHSSPMGPLGTKNTGGMSIYIREVCQWLGGSGHHIDIFTCAGDGPPEAKLYPNVRLITLGEGRFADISKERLAEHLPLLARAVDLYRQDHGVGYDIIHSHYWISGVVGAMIQAQWQIPHLTMFHTLGAAKNRNGSGENETALRIGHEQWLASAADGIVAPSRTELENLETHYHAPRKKIAVVPCGVNLDHFYPRPRPEARQRLGLSPDAEVVLFVGRFAPLKGLDALIEAVAALRPGRPDLQLIVAGGDGPLDDATQALHRKVRRLGLEGVVRFPGRVDPSDLPDYYSAADLLALPSHYESFGLVVLEALACGTPVAATPVGAGAAVVREGHNGVSIPAPEPRAVAHALARFFDTPADQRPSPHQVRASVQAYGWQGVADQLDRLYHAMIAAHHPADALPLRAGAGGLQ